MSKIKELELVEDKVVINVMEKLIGDTYIPITFRNIFKQYIKWQEKNCRCCECRDGHLPRYTKKG